LNLIYLILIFIASAISSFFSTSTGFSGLSGRSASVWFSFLIGAAFSSIFVSGLDSVIVFSFSTAFGASAWISTS